MNKKTLFEIGIKITGLFALWNFVQSIGGIIIAFGIFKMFTGGSGLQNDFMGYIALNMLLTVAIPGLVAFFCLFRTQRVLHLFRLDKGHEEILNLNPRIVYNVIVMISAVAILMHGCANCIIFSYKRDTKVDSSIMNGVPRNSTSINQSETKNVNYIAFAEIIVGIMLLLKSAEVSYWLGRRYEDVVQEQDPAVL